MEVNVAAMFRFNTTTPAGSPRAATISTLEEPQASPLPLLAITDEVSALRASNKGYSQSVRI